MELSGQQMEQLRRVELDILQKFIEVCEKLHIQYFAVQGTLLGAIRHQGFIPWDDDLDVGMLREDYEIFIRNGQKLLPDHYFIQTHDTDPAYPHGFAKIRNSQTAFVETTCKNLPMNHGIYIDVFPFDFYPDNRLKQAVFEVKKLLLRYRIRCSLYIPADNEPTLKNTLRNILKKISTIIYPSLEHALDAQDQLYKSVARGKNVINNGSPWGKRECFPKQVLEGFTVKKFENINIKVPLHFEEYLTHVYGNYMELPPPEKRISHHYTCAVDFSKAYDQVMQSNTQ